MKETIPQLHLRERIRTEIHADADTACRFVAAELAALIRSRADAGLPAVLGLATGSTPVRLYRELIRLHQHGLSMRNVITFNLDEYLGLNRTHPQSYWRFMHEQLFSHVDIPAGNIHIPDGTLPRGEVSAWCRTYEDRIRSAGGLDVQILGIGRTGHIGFNEPGSGRDSRTRLVTLDALTRSDASRDFLGEANVPRHAITMGVGTILEARRIILLAWGEPKARVVAAAVEQPASELLPASFLQCHPAAEVHVDTAAATELARIRHPWLAGEVDWTPSLARRAVVWLSGFVRKPVLKLLDEDYNEHGMAGLLTEQGPAYALNIRIFNELQHTITGWPGGKPGADDTSRPERAAPAVKRVLVLSPEPADEVLGMGGTLRRLVDQGHEVTVAFLTSGSLGVPDEDAAMAAQLVIDLERTGGTSSPESEFAREVDRQLRLKATFDGDTADIRRIKGVLRRCEARAALRTCQVNASRAVFLDLPFYETGRYRQFRPAAPDVSEVFALLREVRPHQIFVTGDLADPSSVPAVCFGIFRQALAQAEASLTLWDCRTWLYRAPGRKWETAEIEMAVPLSPQELTQKIQAICQHRSQRSQSPAAPGLHEAWQQSELCNRALAEAYDGLGLAEYEAIEGFRRLVS